MSAPDSAGLSPERLAGDLRCPNCGASASLPLGATCSDHRPAPASAPLSPEMTRAAQELYAWDRRVALLAECRRLSSECVDLRRRLDDCEAAYALAERWIAANGPGAVKHEMVREGVRPFVHCSGCAFRGTDAMFDFHVAAASPSPEGTA